MAPAWGPRSPPPWLWFLWMRFGSRTSRAAPPPERSTETYYTNVFPLKRFLFKGETPRYFLVYAEINCTSSLPRKPADKSTAPSLLTLPPRHPAPPKASTICGVGFYVSWLKKFIPRGPTVRPSQTWDIAKVQIITKTKCRLRTHLHTSTYKWHDNGANILQISPINRRYSNIWCGKE